jgi:hypothetical protein
MLTFNQLGYRIQGSKRHRIPDPGSATLIIYISKVAQLLGNVRTTKARNCGSGSAPFFGKPDPDPY